MQRPFLILAILMVLAGLAYLLWGGLEENMVYFVTPSELRVKGEGAVLVPVRLGGVVKPDSVRMNGAVLTFDLTDDIQTIGVTTTKAPPQMFQEGMGVVVEGSLQPGGRFLAERLMIKHGNEYRPPATGEMPQEIYKSLERESDR